MRLTRHDRFGRKLILVSMTVASLICVLVVTLINEEIPDSVPAEQPEKPAIFVPGPQTFAPGLHVLGALSPSVAYVLETSDGLILVDCGLRQSHELLLKQMQALHLNVADLKMILITHGHGDHYLGAMQLRELTGAKIYAGAGDSAVLRNAGPREAVFSTFPMDNVPIEPTVVDVELSGSETIELGEAVIQVLATPGHTPGSTCYLVDWAGKTVLFSGDTIMTIDGDLGTYSAYLAPEFRGDAQAYLQTLRDLQHLPAPDLLLPGHPETQRRMVNARVSPEWWSATLSRGIEQMEQLVARFETDGADFLDGIPKQIATGLFYLGDLNQTAVYCLSDDAALILVDAPGGAKLVDFLSEHLKMFGRELPMLDAVILTGTTPTLVAGLSSVVNATGCRIIAAESARADVERLCANAAFTLSEDLPEQLAWLNLERIPVLGFGSERSAWLLNREGKRILFSGLAPLLVPSDPANDWYLTPLDLPEGLRSLHRLAGTRPQIWLPARPNHGQNANLYGRDWTDTLNQSRMSLGYGY
ncbi:MBL fold metallo-hydrolase [bacterium]|nr:MBL fold metallo-hydrolase [bacterium]